MALKQHTHGSQGSFLGPGSLLPLTHNNQFPISCLYSSVLYVHYLVILWCCHIYCSFKSSPLFIWAICPILPVTRALAMALTQNAIECRSGCGNWMVVAVLAQHFPSSISFGRFITRIFKFYFANSKKMFFSNDFLCCMLHSVLLLLFVTIFYNITGEPHLAATVWFMALQMAVLVVGYSSATHHIFCGSALAHSGTVY